VIEERDAARTLDLANATHIETGATPHPSLPLKGDVKKESISPRM